MYKAIHRKNRMKSENSIIRFLSYRSTNTPVKMLKRTGKTITSEIIPIFVDDP